MTLADSRSDALGIVIPRAVAGHRTMASERPPERTMSPGQASMLTVVSWQPTLTEYGAPSARSCSAGGRKAQGGRRPSRARPHRQAGVAHAGFCRPGRDLNSAAGDVAKGCARAPRGEGRNSRVQCRALDRSPVFPPALAGCGVGPRVAMVTEPYSDAPESYYSTAPGRSDRLKALLRPLAYRTAGMALGRSISPCSRSRPKPKPRCEKRASRERRFFRSATSSRPTKRPHPPWRATSRVQGRCAWRSSET